MVGFVETKVEQTKIKQDFVGYALTKQVAGYKHFPGGARLPEKLWASSAVKVTDDAVTTLPCWTESESTLTTRSSQNVQNMTLYSWYKN